MKHARSTKNKGFTLIELIVALAIMGILLAYALPAYYNFSQRQALSNETNNLIGDLNFARNLAIDNSSLVTVASVSGADWGNGWTIMLRLSDGSDQNVRQKQQVAGNMTITETANLSTIIFDSLGAVDSTSQPITLQIQNTLGPILLRVLPSGIISSNRVL